MAFRAASLAKHTRTLSTRLSRQTRISLRAFSCSSIRSSSSFIPAAKPPSYPIDTLIADVLSTNDKLADNPPKARLTGKEPPKEGSFGVDLPPFEEWYKHFPWSTDAKSRSTLANPDICKRLAEAMIPEGSKDKVVLEAFPGPGVLTRALLDLPKERIKRLIVMEDHKNFYQFLKPLEQLDPRITVVPLSGYLWDTYEELSALGLLDDVQVADWSQEHPQLHFISHIPRQVHGEQLVSQFLRSVPEQQWLFKYGRVPLNLLMTDSLWQRIIAPLGSNTRCKLGVVAEATASFDHIIPPEALTPYKQNFWPTTHKNSATQDFVAVSFKPLQNQIIEKGLLDDWDYCLRRMFVQRATPLKTGLPQLAPGAATLLKKVTADSLPPDERINPKTTPRKMTAKEWRVLIQAFVDWPFKPDDLSINNFHVSKTRQDTKKII